MRELAIRAGKEAGRILMDNFGRVHKITKKDDHELVTNVDLENIRLLKNVTRNTDG